jgi:uncharacterized membrane protein SpoIIM required for sporulation
MDYAQFVRLRRPIWESFERQLAATGASWQGLSHAGLEEMALRYRQVLHDHALAASRYPGTAAARQLRGLAIEGNRRLQGGRSEGVRGLSYFFTRAFPAAFRRQLDLLGIAAALFLLAIGVGLSLAVLRPAMALSLLGAEAVTGLEQGQLWTESLVTTTPPSLSTSAIATNNISVALAAWGGGMLAGLVPLYLVLFNGLHLGALAGVTAHYSLLPDLLGFIAAHGPLELTLILVAAAAGMGIGRALVAAGDRPRSLALRDAGRDALVVLLGCLPWFVVLAVVEVFVSPVPALPVPLKCAVGVALEGIFLALAAFPRERVAAHA